MAQNIVLIGPPGSGKTSCGKILAAQLNWPFVDSDSFIETDVKMSVAEIFEVKGEAFFRQLEQDFLQLILDRCNDDRCNDDRRNDIPNDSSFILSCGGGMPVTPGNFEKLEAIGQVVLLTANLETLSDRLKRDDKRPLLSAKLRSKSQVESLSNRLESLLAQRQAVYNRAQYRIDTSLLTAEEAAFSCLKVLNLSPSNI